MSNVRASQPFKSYRFRITRYNGFVYIGAHNDAEAFTEAGRSTDEPGRMEVWNGLIWVGLDSPLRAGLC